MLNGYEYKYYRFLKKREQQYNVDFTQFGVKQVKRLVTVVLPVYNGEDLVEISIKSILEQTYKKIELIVIDDGSTDRTPEIVDAWAKKDKRIVVVHQKNSKLPRALNNGFALAKGEFLTWTSADNKMHRDCIEKLVGYMQRNPKAAMCYANLRAIDAEGAPIASNTWYSRGEHTGNVYLPDATLRLNTYAENTVAAAFMYRRAVPMLIGGYDPDLYTVEDYDYWMRINDTFLLTHTDFDDVIYDYRFHEKSLTAQAKELRINEIREKLMLTEDYRQDWLIRPMCWVWTGDSDVEKWKKIAQTAGHISRTEKDAKALLWPELGTGLVQVTVLDGDVSAQKPARITKDAIRVLVRKGKARPEDREMFDLLVQVKDRRGDVPEGWIQTTDEKAAFDLIQIYCKMRWFDQMCVRNRAEDDKPERKATIVLCTYKRIDKAEKALEAMLAQTVKRKDYEILVVNNDAGSTGMKEVVEHVKKETSAGKLVRYIDCPYPGLSAARNFSLYAAKGEIMLYVDDDGIMEPDCLEKLIGAFESHPDAGVIGGQILLNAPERFSNVILPGNEAIWSERRYEQESYFTAEEDWDFPYGCNYAVRRKIVRALGGFRVSYGRSGKDFAGGEEMVLSHLVKKWGMQVGVEPSAVVIHDVDESRFTLEHVRQTIRASRLTNRLMKMDLYKPYDCGMAEEKYQLTAAKERMAQLQKEAVPEDDLRYLYCRYDIDATEEAIKAGNRDLEIMKREKGSTSEEKSASGHAAPPRGCANRMISAGVHAVGGLCGNGRLGKKVRRVEEELATTGIKRTFRHFAGAVKRRVFKPSKGTIALTKLDEVKKKLDRSERTILANAQQQVRSLAAVKARVDSSERRCLDSLADVRAYVYDFEQRNIRARKLEQINELRQKKKILLIGTAEHKNIGDAAITKAQQELLLDLFPEYYQMEFSTYEMSTMADYLQAIVHKDDLFFLNGGGNLGNRYMPEEELRRRIIQEYPNHKIIIMPQTISFTDDQAGREQLAISAKIYNRHKDLTIFVRGPRSLAFAQEHFTNAKVEMMPDTAFCLRKDYGFERNGALLCMRGDAEKRLDEQDCTYILETVRELVPDIEQTTNMADRDIMRERRAARVNEELRRFAGKKVIVTDRLHGMIFSALTGTPAVVFRSADQKVEEFYQAFFADSNAVFYIGTELSKLKTALEAALNVKQPQYPALDENKLGQLRDYLGI